MHNLVAGRTSERPGSGSSRSTGRRVTISSRTTRRAPSLRARQEEREQERSFQSKRWRGLRQQRRELRWIGCGWRRRRLSPDHNWQQSHEIQNQGGCGDDESSGGLAVQPRQPEEQGCEERDHHDQEEGCSDETKRGWDWNVFSGSLRLLLRILLRQTDDVVSHSA
jgi:hypothetical protein